MPISADAKTEVLWEQLMAARERVAAVEAQLAAPRPPDPEVAQLQGELAEMEALFRPLLDQLVTAAMDVHLGFPRVIAKLELKQMLQVLLTPGVVDWTALTVLLAAQNTPVEPVRPPRCAHGAPLTFPCVACATEGFEEGEPDLPLLIFP